MIYKNLLRMVVLSIVTAPNLFAPAMILTPQQKMLARRNSPVCMGSISIADSYADSLRAEDGHGLDLYCEAAEHLEYLRGLKGRVKCLRNRIAGADLSDCTLRELEEVDQLDLWLGNATLNSSLLEEAIANLNSALKGARSLMDLVEAFSPSPGPESPPVISGRPVKMGLPRPRVHGIRRK